MEGKINIGSICCGMGGFDYGLNKLGFNTVWAIDIMEDACKSFKMNFPQTNVYIADAHKIKNFRNLSEGTNCNNLHGLTFGVPCQGFSRANAKRYTEDPRNSVYLATLRALEQLNCEFFIFENVQGLLDMTFSDGSSVFQKMKRDYELCGKGYNVSYKLIDCSTVGVPQANRLRLIMIGFRKDLNFEYRFFDLTHGPGKIPFVTLKDTIWHLKNVNQKGMYYNEPYDSKFLSRNRQKDWDQPSYTIEASARYAKIHPDGGKMTKIGFNRWNIPETCRRLSVIESKLIQTFPEDYKIFGNLQKQYELIGNAVPPKLAEFIGLPIKKYYESLEKNSRILSVLKEKVKQNPNNSFYKGLLSWGLSGKNFTKNQLKYIIN